ncbi:hypothetical protein [Luteolibacter sp. LG18]|uniref:hypothetical protein n=1 Tax=Luteolibacter sp. LG18 TaxID=2819286 RepID=UPI002B29452D|nr:hypothetical protein llg_37710 [Luteolibacter sp. LG18]
MVSDRRTPFWLLPNLLSLDAPLVAVAWLWVFGKTWRANYLPVSAYVVLGLVVWAIYVFDRLLDAAMRTGTPELLEERHRFHLKHRKWFAIGGVLAGLGALITTLAALPVDILNYALFGGVLVLGFFALNIFTNHRLGQIPYTKNVMAGMAFAYGTAVAAHVYLPAMDGWSGFRCLDLLLAPEVICFGVLCIANISAIDLWEKVDQGNEEERATADLTLTLLLLALSVACLVFAVMERNSRPDTEGLIRPYYYSVFISAALLYILNRCRHLMSNSVLRVLVDAVFLVPVAIFVVLPTHLTA